MEFPRDKDKYVLTATIGTDEASTMHEAKHVNPITGVESPVCIKVFRLNQVKDVYFLSTQFHQAKICSHQNTVNVHCSFKTNPDNQLWVIMSPLPGFSIRSVIRSSFPHGLPEKSVSFILKETLKALNHMHAKNVLHRYIGADCIFPCGESSIKIALSSFSYHPNNESWSAGDCNQDWTIAPEFRTGSKAESTKEGDVWMFGLLALELFYGRIPASNLEKFEKLLKNMMAPLGGGSSRFVGKLGSCFSGMCMRKEMPEQLREVVAACLCDKPEKRPTTNQLMMEYDLFQMDFPGSQSLAEFNKACRRMR